MEEPEDAHIWGFLGFVTVLLQYNERKTDLGSELSAKICDSDLWAVDLGSELGAMDPGAEHEFKTHGQVSLAEAAFISSSSLSGSSSP